MENPDDWRDTKVTEEQRRLRKAANKLLRQGDARERKVKREKRHKKPMHRERWQDQRSKWRAQGRKMFGGEEGRQRAAAAVRAALAQGRLPPLWSNWRTHAPSVAIATGRMTG